MTADEMRFVTRGQIIYAASGKPYRVTGAANPAERLIAYQHAPERPDGLFGPSRLITPSNCHRWSLTRD